MEAVWQETDIYRVGHVFAGADAAIILLLRYHRRAIAATGPRPGVGNGYSVRPLHLPYLTIATSTLVAASFLLLPLYVALVGGDLVAKEAEDGTLRMILSRPISRVRLLLLKWASGVVFSIVLVVSFGLFAALFARLFFPSGGLFVMIPWLGVFGAFEGAWTAGNGYVIAHGALMVEACTIMSLAFMFSCLDIKPAAATILAISAFFISKILQDIPYFRDLQEWFFTYHLNMWASFFLEKIPWWQLGQSLSILAAYNLTFVVIGCCAFQLRDIKS